MDLDRVYLKGVKIWLRDEELVWRKATLTEDFSQNFVNCVDENNEVFRIAVKSNEEFPPLANPDILIGGNDLTALSYLHEPAVLYNLQYRFLEQNCIYTYCGIVLVAINPYAKLPLYGDEIIRLYRGHNVREKDPHIFAVAEEAFTDLTRHEKNQSIIVSGESGAGKTVSAKYAMRYFAVVGANHSLTVAVDTNVERKVLASNPIMEAMGNAKTVRNDNSSRFGKFTQINFTPHFHISGAHMKTYLLEKSRVVFQAENERNYHIFYQICSQANNPKFKDFHLRSANDFTYTNQGNDIYIPDVDDSSEFKETCKAMSLLGITDDEITSVIRVLASILHLGNILFERVDSESCTVEKASESHLKVVSGLLGIDPNALHRWLTHRRIVAVQDTVVKPLTDRTAFASKDALAKRIYASTFDWLVSRVNVCLKSVVKTDRFVGVLDIYGFETFDSNSFEQFCINYANEKLQQQFNQHVFKLEQDEYVREGIVWSFINFDDNQPCIDLIESHLGVLDLLDEECKMPKGSEMSWLEKMSQKHKSSPLFELPKLHQKCFLIRHFADEVVYDIDGFLEKNRDSLNEDLLNVMRQSQSDFFANLMCEGDENSNSISAAKKFGTSPTSKKRSTLANGHGTVGPQKSFKKSVAVQFRESLKQLMVILNSTTPHYVRCVKPNDDKSAFTFEPIRAVQQLRACGVLETVRISAAGYPSRYSYEEFYNRYRLLLHSKMVKRNNYKATAEAICQHSIKDPTNFAFGKTKIFFRTGQVALLEQIRTEKRHSSCVLIQKTFRGWICRRRYQTIKQSLLILQRSCRAFLAYRRLRYLQMHRAVICIQSGWRMHQCRQKYINLRSAVVAIQARFKAVRVRRRMMEILLNKKARVIQRCVRRWLAKANERKFMKRIVLLQSCVRRWLAKRELKRLKIEARSVQHVQELNKGLENKIISLQMKINEMNYERQQTDVKMVEYAELKSRLKAMEKTASELSVAHKTIASLEQEIGDLKGPLSQLALKLESLEAEKRDSEKRNKLELERLSKENQDLRMQCGNFSNIIEELNISLEEKRQEVRTLDADLDNSRKQYQAVLLEMNYGHQQSLDGSASRSSSPGLSDQMSRVVNETVGPQPPNPEPPLRVNLVLRQQEMISQMSRELGRANDKVDRLKRQIDLQSTGAIAGSIVYSSIKTQDLEIENQKLKQENQRLIEAGVVTPKDVIELLNVSQEELAVKKEENISLRAMLSQMMADATADGSESKRSMNSSNVSEREEIYTAFIQQKAIIQQQTEQLDSQDASIEDLRRQLEISTAARQANYQPQQHLENHVDEKHAIKQEVFDDSHDLNQTASVPDPYIQQELAHLVSENLHFREKLALKDKEIKRLKRKTRDEDAFAPSQNGISEVPDLKFRDGHFGSSTPQHLRHLDYHYMGMLECSKNDCQKLFQIIISNLKPKVAAALAPCLPAYVVFMCLRHADYSQNEEKFIQLFEGSKNSIVALIKSKKHQDDFELLTMWLSNVIRLTMLFKQYGVGEGNDAEYKSKGFKFFDPTEHLVSLCQTAEEIFLQFRELVWKKFEHLIVPCVLEYSSVSLMMIVADNSRSGAKKSKDKTTETLLDAMKEIHQKTVMYGLDLSIIRFVLRQILNWISVDCLNNLLMRKDLCNFASAMQIRHNVGAIESWCKDNNMATIVSELNPLIQACQLLMSNKQMANVVAFAGIVTDLNVSQVVKLLNLYTGDPEEKPTKEFIMAVQHHLLKENNNVSDGNSMGVVYKQKDDRPLMLFDRYTPTNIALESIEIPAGLQLHFLRKL